MFIRCCWSAIVLMLLLVPGGCTSEQVKKPTAQATNSTVDSALRTLSAPQGQQLLDAVAQSPAVENAARQVARGLVSGSVEAGGAVDSPLSTPTGRQLKWGAIILGSLVAISVVALIAGIWSLARSARQFRTTHRTGSAEA
jgi:PBP1b-binding outer membrane lipoprotein LpoB